MGRLNYSRANQKILRADLYNNVSKAMNKDHTNTASSIGKPVILPATFTGGPRHMEQLFHDAMEFICTHGKTDLFVTFITNPNILKVAKTGRGSGEPILEVD
jgi:hypothetical protein